MSDSDSDAPPGYIDFDNVETNEGWWDDGAVQAVKKGERRWTTLSHNGVMFPPPYEPHGIPILYAGREFHMTPEEEEVATMFAKLRENDYYRQPEFRQNFFKSWMKILNKRGEHPIRELELCNFDKIWEWWQRQREIKKNRTREEKKKDKDEQNKIAAPFKYCIWDGKKEEVANYRVEPPELFRGRGEHPLRGTLKRRVTPEDITINIDPTAKPPPCPAGHKWGAIVHDNTKTWLATWEDNVTGGTKYVMLAPSSTVKGVSDREKFERARRLHKHIDKIRKWYRDQMSSSDEQQQQLGVATYFIDKLALRVGNEKSTDEADTVGCCSLRVEHCTPLPNNQLHLHFLGKDSIPYDNIVDVDAQVYKLVQQFLHGKREKKMIFDLVDPSDLNDNFKQFMPDLTAKVFRTYNASKCLEDYFQANPLPKKASLSEKMVYFNKANTEVAVLCNHQKSVSKGHVKLMAKMSAQIEIQRATIERLRKAEKELAKKGAETVAREFFAAQDAEQQEWLDQYGTEQEKEEFEKEKIERFEKPIKTSGTKSSPSKTSGKKKPSSGGTKTRTIDDLDDDDVPLVALAGRTSGRATKKEPKKEEKVKVEPDDDDDTPIAALLPGKNGKGGKKAASVKKEKTPEPQEDEADEEGEEEEEEEGEEEEEEEQPAKGGKKPAAKKSPAKSKKTSPKKPAAKKAAKKASGKKPAGKAAAGKKKKPAPKKGGKKK